METRLCTNCDTEKDISSFQLAKKKRRDGTPYECRLWSCNQCEWQKKKVRGKGSKDYELRRNFDIGIEDYNAMFNEQNGVCYICERHPHEVGDGRALAVDHCHHTGTIRGLLCGDCNRGVGLMQDDINLLRRAVKYLERFET